MSSYKVEFTDSAAKDLKKLPFQARLRIINDIYKLSMNPRKGDSRPMIGIKSWRRRVGDYRVVYDIYDEKLVILIIKVGHRRNIYRQF